MQGFTGINLRDERIDYIERKDLDDVVIDAVSNLVDVVGDDDDYDVCDEFDIWREREHYIIKRDGETEDGKPLYTVTRHTKGYYDVSPGNTCRQEIQQVMHS